MDETITLRFDHLDEAVGGLKEQDEKQWIELDKIKHEMSVEFARIRQSLTRLIPAWVGIILTVAGLITGASVGIATMIMKFAGE